MAGEVAENITIRSAPPLDGSWTGSCRARIEQSERGFIIRSQQNSAFQHNSIKVHSHNVTRIDEAKNLTITMWIDRDGKNIKLDIQADSLTDLQRLLTVLPYTQFKPILADVVTRQLVAVNTRLNGQAAPHQQAPQQQQPPRQSAPAPPSRQSALAQPPRQSAMAPRDPRRHSAVLPPYVPRVDKDGQLRVDKRKAVGPPNEIVPSKRQTILQRTTVQTDTPSRAASSSSAIANNRGYRNQVVPGGRSAYQSQSSSSLHHSNRGANSTPRYSASRNYPLAAAFIASAQVGAVSNSASMRALPHNDASQMATPAASPSLPSVVGGAPTPGGQLQPVLNPAFVQSVEQHEQLIASLAASQQQQQELLSRFVEDKKYKPSEHQGRPGPCGTEEYTEISELCQRAMRRACSLPHEQRQIILDCIKGKLDIQNV